MTKLQSFAEDLAEIRALSRRSVLGGAGSSYITLCTSPCSVSASKGLRPVSSSYSATPRQYMS